MNEFEKSKKLVACKYGFGSIHFVPADDMVKMTELVNEVRVVTRTMCTACRAIRREQINIKKLKSKGE